jgi:hypothetical protein
MALSSAWFVPLRTARWTSASRATGVPRVDGQHRRRVRTPAAVEHPHPQHRLGLGHVVAPQGDGIAPVDVGVAARLAVGAEALLQRRRRGGGAQAGVAVHVGRPDAGLPDHAQRVVLLQEQLAAGVEADPVVAVRLGQRGPHPVDDDAHGLVPPHRHQLSVLADQRCGEAVGGVVGLPAVEILGVDPSVVHPVVGPTPHPDDPAPPDGQVEPVAVGVEHRRGRHPPLDIGLGHAVGQVLVDPHRPRLLGAVRRAVTPRVGDAVRRPGLVHRAGHPSRSQGAVSPIFS